MADLCGRVVKASAGRDSGALFFIVGERDGFLLLADGKRRKCASPKRKNLRHTALLPAEETLCSAGEALRKNLMVSDRALRRALAALRGR